MGKLVYQFKSFAINQVQFVTNEIFGDHGDLQRRVRAIGLLTTAFPAFGAFLHTTRSALMGETFTSKMWDETKRDPNFINLITTAAVMTATAGGLGIVADAALTATTGNKFALTAFAVSPTFSSAINALDIGASVFRGVMNRDSLEFERALQTGAREFGGMGTIFTRRFEDLGLLTPREQRRQSGGGSSGFGGFGGFGGG